MVRAFLAQDQALIDQMQHVQDTNGQGKICVLYVTHCLTVGWIASINEIISRQYVRINVNNPLAIKTQSQLRNNDFQEFSHILQDLAASKQSGKPSLSS